MNKIIEQAVAMLKKGGIIIYPTDTAYGIGCRVDDARAASRLLGIKGRPKNKPMPILVSDIAMARRYAGKISPKVEKLMQTYWPGGLTIVVSLGRGTIAPAVTGGKDTVGIRMPDDDQLLEIIKHLDVAIVGSSANFSGQQTPFSMSELDPKLVKQVDFVVDGACGGGMSSTVIDTTVKPWRILRQGKVKVHEVTS